MTIRSNLKNDSLFSVVVSSPFRYQVLSLLRQTFLASLLVGLIWLPGLPLKPALALSNAVTALPGEMGSKLVDSTSIDSDRMSALITCLPKQLSQPGLKRALSEMGNDQLERAFNLKTNPKLSQAEVELTSCMNSKGFIG